MPSSAGSFYVSGPGTTFTATFVVDEITHSFTGSFGGTSVEPCTGVVTLTYANPGDLTSSRNFQGVIGKTSAKITLANAVEISGTLDNPISIANTVTGTGRWGVTKFAD
ncbi:MAG: hypothetical protein JOS17DRAFT_747048 [Linnemannia elongata]|nr:MAG: hypothetical protein JOS17DRAFT_817601 [Linnemannia elongata]KAK3830125.1 MAG: hypothetical protein JOS17DRAFT_747048 [Linnemannia elongata]